MAIAAGGPAFAQAASNGPAPPVKNTTASPSSGTDWQTTVDDAARNEAQKRLDEEQKTLEQSRKEQDTLEQSFEQLIKERDQITDRLVATAKQVQASEAALTATEAKLSGLATQETTIRASLKDRQGVLIKLLMALQRMGRDPPPVMITERDDALKMVRSAMQLAAVFPELRDKAAELAKQLSDLDSVIAGIKKESADQLAERQKLADEQVRLDELLRHKHQELDARAGELQKLRDAVGEQAKTVASLAELIDKSDRAVALKGTLGESDKSLLEASIASDTTSAPSGGEPPPSPKQPLTQASLKPGGAEAPAGSHVRMQSLEGARGSLPRPVEGKKILGFGDPTRNVGRSKGEAFAARPGAQVTSPSDGLVVYAGEFRSYGQILIINVGGGYHVLLAGLGQLDVATGQSVVAGEPVGKLGNPTTSASSDAASDLPILYVEFRDRDKPINPAPYWAGDSEKVQG
jgi:septal ring factor EnvC (AmiA/AmiB activator)